MVALSVEHRTSAREVVGSILSPASLPNNLGQVIHSYMHLSPSRITGYWPKGGDKPTCRCEDNRGPGGSLPPGA